MAEREPMFNQALDYNAQQLRHMLAALFGSRPFVDLAPEVSKVNAGGGHGVIMGTDLAVTAGAGHSVNVAAGMAAVRGTHQGDEGVRLVENDASENVLIATPDATNPRIDLVVAEVLDTAFGDGSDNLVLRAVTGTPAGVPAAPACPESSLVLAEVLVPASAPSSASYTVTDRRTRAAALGGLKIVDSTLTYPNPAGEGEGVYDKNLDRPAFYDGTGWRQHAPVTAGLWTGTLGGTNAEATVTHGLGTTPSSVVVSLYGPNTTAAQQQVGQLIVQTLGATTFEVRVRRSDTGALLVGETFGFTWVASK